MFASTSSNFSGEWTGLNLRSAQLYGQLNIPHPFRHLIVNSSHLLFSMPTTKTTVHDVFFFNVFRYVGECKEARSKLTESSCTPVSGRVGKGEEVKEG